MIHCSTIRLLAQVLQVAEKSRKVVFILQILRRDANS
jgi:hypothetical protein